jgi:hypothetical protein
MSGKEDHNPLDEPPGPLMETEPDPTPLLPPPPPVLAESVHDGPGPTDAVNMEPNEFPHASGIAGHEEILYGAPQDFPVNNPVAIFDYVLWALVLYLLIRIVAGVFIIAAYSAPPLNFAPLILFLFLAQFAKIGLDGYFLLSPVMAENRHLLIFNIVTESSMALVYLAIYLALNKSIAIESLPYFVGAHLFFCVLRLCMEVPSNIPSSGGFYLTLEALQLLIIANKIGVTDGSVNWTWSILFFYVVAIFLLILGFFVGLIFAGFIGIWIFSDAFRQLPALVKWAIAAILFSALWMCLVFYMLVSGFEMLATGFHLGFGNPKGTPETRMRTAAYLMVVCGIISMVAALIIIPFIKALILESLRKGRAKEVTLKSFAETLNLDVTRVSENFFRPTAPGPNRQNGDVEMGAQNPNRAPLGEDEGLCIVCQDKKSDVIIKPCGHGGFCTDCMKEYLKEKDDCSLCRAKIDEVYLVVEDPQTHAIKARGVIKLKR